MFSRMISLGSHQFWNFSTVFGFIVIAITSGVSAQGEFLDTLVVSAASDDEKTEEVASESDSGEDSEAAKEKEKSEDDPREDELKELRLQRDLLSAKNALATEKRKIDLAELKAEKEFLQLENSVSRERLNNELLEAKLNNERLNAEIETLNKEILLESALVKQSLQKELAGIRYQEEVLKSENALAAKEVEKEMTRLRLNETKLKLQRSELEVEVATLQAKLKLREQTEILGDHVFSNEDKMYLSDPYVDDVLYVSDRRISLNGPIWSFTASFVSERINYYNNQSIDYPIFIIIDSSPGGSVMAGYRILKAMHGSQAPVYVVVKSYAASMAATIATLAEKSYAYPNAIILHHQISWGAGGNLTQQREFLEEAQEWWRRLAKPIAQKMGLDLEEFIELMYNNNSDGDWREFGDNALELKWIDVVVENIWEMSIDKNPDRFGNRGVIASGQLAEMRDMGNNPYVELPSLEPFDFYYLYNPSNYYRLK